MRKIPLILLFLYSSAFAAGSPEWQYNPCSHLEVGFEFGQCIDKYHAQSEKKLNATFQNMLKIIGKDDPNGQKHWQQSQKMWRNWVNYECQPNDPHHNSSYVPAMIKMCQANKMQLRERHLRYIYTLDK